MDSTLQADNVRRISPRSTTVAIASHLEVKVSFQKTRQNGRADTHTKRRELSPMCSHAENADNSGNLKLLRCSNAKRKGIQSPLQYTRVNLEC